MLNRWVFTMVFLGMIHVSAWPQSVYILHAEGVVKICKTMESEQAARKIQFGNLATDDKLILKEKARVKMIREDGTMCELTKAGTYPVNQLVFSKPMNNSFVAQMGGFIKSFFQPSHSSESKSSYKSTVHAISRGEPVKPTLIFPMEGLYPSGMTSIEFSWILPCDTCKVKFSVYAFKDRKKVIDTILNQKSFVLKNPDKLFEASKEYYWQVTLPAIKLEYEVRSLQFSATNDFEQQVKAAKSNLVNSGVNWPKAARFVYINQYLADQGGVNYQWLFGKNELTQNKKDADYQSLVQGSQAALLKKIPNQ